MALKGGGPRQEVALPTDAFEPEVAGVIQRARELAERFGHAHVGEQHVGLALAERLDDPYRWCASTSAKASR